MSRRLFVKNTSIFSMGLMAFSGSSLWAKNTTEDTTVIDLTPINPIDKKITLAGNIIDATTLLPINGCKMTVKAKTNRLFKTTREIATPAGVYSIITGFSTSRKLSKMLEVTIEAPGYKTYSSFINLSTTGCHLHSEEWNYNKNFNPMHCPQNNTENQEILSNFDFRLIR
ncbi:hypothetical protein [Flavobacterium sp.]|uniref:hypothetical protein n=1 Tax=Flavobacterium sp. TaxID=239 RepID=UPI003D0E323A